MVERGSELMAEVIQRVVGNQIVIDPLLLQIEVACLEGCKGLIHSQPLRQIELHVRFKPLLVDAGVVR